MAKKSSGVNIVVFVFVVVVVMYCSGSGGGSGSSTNNGGLMNYDTTTSTVMAFQLKQLSHHHHHHYQGLLSSQKSSFHDSIKKESPNNNNKMYHHPSQLHQKRLLLLRQLKPLAMSSSMGGPMMDNNNNNDDDGTTTTTTTTTRVLVGDDAAYFDISQQSIEQWIKFIVATTTVLGSLSYIWFLPNGLHGGDIFLNTIQSNIFYTTTDPTITVTIMLIVFATIHSGMAGLRTYIEPIIGARIWRVFFAMMSLPLALSCISYFINHAHDGIQLWDIHSNNELYYEPYIHTALYITNFISFLFLYPSTFNLLEIAAIEKPQLHLYETGIIRITRHPQAMGQILWCIAHSIYLGSSTAIAACTILILHHIFSIYHGDRRLISRHGIDKFNYIQNQTSIIPFAAILDGRQQLPNDYYKEFLRVPYLVVVIGTTIAYMAHPYMQAGAALLHW